MQLPAGWLVDHFDVKWVFATGFFVWSAATAVTGIFHGFIALLMVRMVLGIGESVAFPSYSKILRTLFRRDRRGFANAMIIAGLSLGPAIGMLVGGSVVGRFGWRPFFLVLGLLGLVWLMPWAVWMPPRTKPSKLPAAPWSGLVPILRQRSAWGTCVGQFCVNYYLYFLVTWMPFYLVRGRHLSMGKMARDGGLLFLMSAVAASIWGKLSDHWISAGSSPTFVRKGSMALGALASLSFWQFSQSRQTIFSRGCSYPLDVPRHRCMPDMGDPANSRRPRNGWPMGRHAELRRKFCRRCCSRADRISARPDRLVLLAILHSSGRRWNRRD